MKLSHLDEKGNLRMVDITKKKFTLRTATASGFIKLMPSTLKLIKKKQIKKGDIFACARLAGILVSKRVSEIIPLTHNIDVTHSDVRLESVRSPSGIKVVSTVKTNYATGVEMEALTSASVALLTIYDMVKSVEKTAEITEIRLIRKTGAKTCEY